MEVDAGRRDEHGMMLPGGATGGSEDRLWQQFDQRTTEKPLSRARVLLMGFAPAALSRMREELHSAGVRMVASCPSVKQLDNVVGMGLSFNLVVVNGDAFTDIDNAVDNLICFRCSAPHVRVLFVSTEVKGDDFGSDRRAICDATVRAPVSADRLRAGVRAALMA